MTCWEYDIKMIRMGDWDDTKTDLNEMGIDGWELIKFDGHLNDDGKSMAFFKRVIDEADMGVC